MKAKFLLPLAAVFLMAGCAQVPPDAGSNPEDPYESFNRQMFYVNDQLDRKVLKPVTTGYRWLVPEYARDRVSDALSNLSEPTTAANSFLQGKGGDGVTSVFRFLVNSTFGIAGIFDVAEMIGMPKKPEDFGQTLGVWGVGEGSYLVLPLLGPSGTRDMFRYPFAVATDAGTYLLHNEDWYAAVALAGVAAVDMRSEMMDKGLDDMRGNILDEYVAVRDAYRQQRRHEIADGNVSEEETLETLTPLSFDDYEDEDDEDADKGGLKE